MRLELFFCPKAPNMPKGQTKKITSKQSPISLALLLVKIILIGIGNIPFLVIQGIVDICTTIMGHLSKLRIPIPAFPFSLFTFPFSRQSRKRGRPKNFHLSRKSKFTLGLTTFLVFLSLYTVFILTAAYQLPSPTKLSSPVKPLTTEFYDRNGTLLYRLYADQNRTLVELSEVPKHLIEATIAIEDRNFYRHIGIDPLAMMRAIEHNLKYGSQEGASTITQQLIKNSLLTPERSYIRKVREIILALWAERIYSKDEILQMYFNEAPYGGANIGIAAAAEVYFGKFPAQLSLAEGAYLAGLPASPTQLYPYGEGASLAKIRQRQVLDRMAEERFISQAEADETYGQDLNLRPPTNHIKAAHLVMYVRDVLTQKYGPRIVSQGGLKVITSLDLGLQEKLEAIVKEEADKLASLNVQNAASMVTDKNGQILAMVGSKDYDQPNFGNFNVTTSLRQPGSSIKVVTYATAFKKGFSPGNTILDAPVSFKDGTRTYSPVNYDNSFHGPVSIRTALGSSYNVPAVKMLATVGLDEMIKTAKDLGITTFNDPSRFGLSLTLGGGEVKMIDMMSVYGTLANLGVKMYPTAILKVTDSNGNVLEESSGKGERILSSEITYLITDILEDNKARTPAFGPNSLLQIPGYEVAVKTGTSDNKRDNWTFGYTPKFVVGVWVGNPDNSPMNPALTSGITGAAPIWNKIMHTLLDGTKPLAFEKPAGIAEVKIDGRKDLALSGAIPKALVRVIKNEDKLVFSDSFSSYATPSAQQADQVSPPQSNL